MHIPDGFINAPVSAAGAVVAVAGLSLTSWRASKTLEDKQVPLAGLIAAFIFAMQMINFPVANGTSGHLLGGTWLQVSSGHGLRRCARLSSCWHRACFSRTGASARSA